MGEWSSSARCNPCILLPNIRAHYEKEGREGILTAEVCVLNNFSIMSLLIEILKASYGDRPDGSFSFRP